MENRTLEKITTILTNLENEKKNEKAKIDEMFEEYTSKVNNALHPYLEFVDTYQSIVRPFDKKFHLDITITAEELYNIIDYEEVYDVFGEKLTNYFFSMGIKFNYNKDSGQLTMFMKDKDGLCRVQAYCNYNNIRDYAWQWMKRENKQNCNSYDEMCAILVEYLDVLYPYFERKMLEYINTKYSEDLNNVHNSRVSIEETLNALKSNKEKRTDSIREIIIQKLEENKELCERLIDRTSYAMAHMTLTDYAIGRAQNMSDTDLELIYNDIMNIEED